jgi:hypothetical protein
MRVNLNGTLFVTSAFPFLIPLVGSTDTHPTFTLLTILFAIVAAVQCMSHRVTLRKSDLLLASAIFASGLIWLCLSLLVNSYSGNLVNRQITFVMLLLAIATGILNRGIFTPKHIVGALKIYILFTALFFLTKGAIESLIIQSRSEGVMENLLLTGRGASTLSPEPSFFAFQIFTIFLISRLTVWNEFTNRQRHFVQLSTIGLLISSLGGYGMLYALMTIFLSGRRYMIAASIGVIAAVAFQASRDLESLRFVKLLLTLSGAIARGDLNLSDMSVLARLTSFQEYWDIFTQNIVFGDGFSFFGGGGMISLLASLGLYGLALISLTLFAILLSHTRWRLKVVLIAWLALQLISGPIGLPFIGLTIGLILTQTREMTLLSKRRMAEIHMKNAHYALNPAK